MAAFSCLPAGGQRVALLLEIGQLFIKLTQALLAGPVLFLLGASRSISICMIWRSSWSSSCGLEVISIRSRPGASSIRSMALSGRNRSLM